MDRGLLSDAEVVAASRAFVCVRLLTYENEEEGKFLQGVFAGRSGQLENSVFALLAPDGSQLTRGGRSPEMVFGRRGDAKEAMVRKMKRVAERYPGNKDEKPRALPTFSDLRRALNGAACDLQPLVVVADDDAKRRAATIDQLRPLAWSNEHRGVFAYVVVTDLTELKAIGAEPKPGVYIVEPDAYGLKGKVLAQREVDSKDELEKLLSESVSAFRPEAKDSRSHIRKGRRSGKNWKPETPVTDPQERRRGRG